MSELEQARVVRLVDIRETALDPAEVIGALGDDAAGGLNLFIGLVRDHDRGQGVSSLDYSAHPSALARLHDVCDRIAGEYEVHGLAALHRVGHLAIGDIAVIVATTASHRDVAFTASRALIDTLKSEVPIWKNQRFEDGAQEWVGLP